MWLAPQKSSMFAYLTHVHTNTSKSPTVPSASQEMFYGHLGSTQKIFAVIVENYDKLKFKKVIKIYEGFRRASHIICIYSEVW